jgi:hypothetical protein
MTSCWGKLLIRDVAVPINLTFAWSEGATPHTVIVLAGTYDTILDVAEALQDAIDTEISPSTSTVTIDQLGTVSIYVPGMTAVNWVTTSTGFSTIFGFDRTETVTGATVVSTYQHQYGWYPGAITWNRDPNRGAGVSSGPRWTPQDASVATTSGAGYRHRVGPGRPPRLRTLRFDLLYKTEVQNRTIGVDALEDRFFASRMSWYPDRTVGEVGAPGVTGDPRLLTDADVDYWVVTLQDIPTEQTRSEHPDWYSVELRLNGEPGA